jgi:hypothetical protein
MERIGETASEEAVFRIEGRFDQPAATVLISNEETLED